VYPPCPPRRLCSKMCSRPCLPFTNRYKKGGTNSSVPPTVSYYLQRLPTVSVPSSSDSKSRGRKLMRVRPPPPAPLSFLITSPFIRLRIGLCSAGTRSSGVFCTPRKRSEMCERGLSGRSRKIPVEGKTDRFSYIFGGKLEGSTTYQTSFKPWPPVSPLALSPPQ